MRQAVAGGKERMTAGEIRASWRSRLYRLADGADRRWGARLRSSAWSDWARIQVLDAVVAQQSDRVYMRRTILPALAAARPQRVLFVGVRGYTRHYAQAFRGLPVEFWTSDIDPAAARYGSPSRHVTEDLCELHNAFPPEFFDVAVINGVLGWGVDRPEDQSRALSATAQVLKREGHLLLGWNADRSPDPDAIAGIEAFARSGFAGLPPRKDFTDATHVYAWYRKR
jgi:SAM-dependent methyltransferase